MVVGLSAPVVFTENAMYNRGMSGDQLSPRSARLHRALASPARVRLLDALRDEPRDAWALAEQLELHVNTIRGHLAVLEEAGLVSSETEQRRRPGRPRVLYRRAADDVGLEDASYRLLAEALVGWMETDAADPAGSAEAAGSSWGGQLVERPSGVAPLDAESALERVVALLDDLGFAPELDDSGRAADGEVDVLLRHCPFLEVARDHQAVVCGLHLGLVRGALATLDAGIEVAELQPLVEPGLCVCRLEVPA